VAFLAAVPAAGWVSAASTALTLAATYQQAKGQEAIAEQTARDREEDANVAAAESQRESILQRKRAQQLMSRARAVAGASGAGVSDPTVSDIITDIGTQGEYNALSALASGNAAARGYRQGARNARNEGKAAMTAGYAKMASTALGGGSSWYEKYGVRK
jgi:hypothetical protein